MIYETYADLARRVRSWCRELPEFVAVAGIGRSGSIVASMIACERNIHLVHTRHIDEFEWTRSLRRNVAAKDGSGTVLVVDDAVSSGNTMRNYRAAAEMMNLNCQFGAVYVQEAGRSQVDFAAVNVGSEDHVFEWNVFHHWFTNQMLFDLDGILCDDWPYTSEEGDLAEKYAEHLASARCLIRPSFPIGEIVTGRLEQHRDATESWLQRHGIQYRKLTMSPFASPRDRDMVGPGHWKGETFRNRPGAKMFIESCPHQAETIAKIASRPVLSWPENRVWNGTVI